MCSATRGKQCQQDSAGRLSEVRCEAVLFESLVRGVELSAAEGTIVLNALQATGVLTGTFTSSWSVSLSNKYSPALPGYGQVVWIIWLSFVAK